MIVEKIVINATWFMHQSRPVALINREQLWFFRSHMTLISLRKKFCQSVKSRTDTEVCPYIIA